jgi:myo-inositol-1(or 4)-monophosphatase
MTADRPDLGGWLALAERVARSAGEVLLERQRRISHDDAEFKGRRTELVTAADRAAERAVVEPLLAACPEHGVLAEEGVLTPSGRAHRQADLLWVVDPLDGTTNFVHRLPFYAVSVCLVEAGDPLLGVVHAPALGWTFTATRGGRALRNGETIAVSATTEIADALLATGFSYNRSEAGADDNVERVRRALHGCRDLRRYGSAALDLCMTAMGVLDGFWELYLQPYDVAAGALIVMAAGGQVTDLCGGANWLRGGEIAASNGHLQDQLLALVGGTP